jgi:hypothetical protein
LCTAHLWKKGVKETGKLGGKENWCLRSSFHTTSSGLGRLRRHQEADGAQNYVCSLGLGFSAIMKMNPGCLLHPGILGKFMGKEESS